MVVFQREIAQDIDERVELGARVVSRFAVLICLAKSLELGISCPLL
jgi:hypothetical protein